MHISFDLYHPAWLLCSKHAHLAYFKRKLLETTLTLDIAISALAHIGVIWKLTPKRCNTPAASGMQSML